MNEMFEKAIEVLESDGVIAFKTDTVMGVAANGLSRKAVEKLFLLKKRSFDKPVALLLPTFSSIFQYGVVTEKALNLMKRFFPGAFTCILKAKQCIFTTPLGCADTIGIRVPGNIKLREFLSAVHYPLVTTSANISGFSPLTNKVDVLETFHRAVYYIELSIEMSKVASTVADCSNGKVKLLREGNVKI